MIETKPSVVNKRIYINTYGDEHDKTSVALGELYSLNIDETISELQKNGQWLKMIWGFLKDWMTIGNLNQSLKLQRVMVMKIIMLSSNGIK